MSTIYLIHLHYSLVPLIALIVASTRPPPPLPGIIPHLILQSLGRGVVPSVIEINLASLYGHWTTRGHLGPQLVSVIQ